MAKTVTLRIDNESYKAFSKRAKAEKRSLSNYIEIAAMEYSRQAIFADDAEMDGIMADKSLIRRLRQGSREASRKKGRFVD